MTPLPRIMVAPNGARLGKSDHPAVPVTTAEIVATLRACHAAGADGAHIHIRDAQGAHLLDAATYRDTLAGIRAEVPRLALQITTEAAGRYDTDTQMAVALNSGAGLVSVATREICRAGATEARAFFVACAAAGIAVQHILYDRADCDLLHAVLPGDALRAPGLQLLYVLGRYSQPQEASPGDLDPFLAWQTENALAPDWAVCAFGRTEPACLLRAAALGGKCRTGFENALCLGDGTLARDNAEKVRDLCARLGRP